jgi:orotidine-5'-phosphate decarboxylase
VNFINKLSAAWTANDSLLCVGLDPDIARMPPSLQNQPDGIVTFCTAIMDATFDLACSFKPQIAYFAALGAERQLEHICRYAREHYPHIPLILDAKRGDIGATAHQYAREAFDRYKADAVTVNPYMGFDSVQPYMEWEERGVIVLCRTSNPGGSDLQFLNVDGQPLYQHVARLVVGATFPHELAAVRAIVGDMPLLVPGIGAQGGDVRATVRAGKTFDGMGMMVNSSRAILYAAPEPGEDYVSAARRVALATRDEINLHRA